MASSVSRGPRRGRGAAAWWCLAGVLVLASVVGCLVVASRPTDQGVVTGPAAPSRSSFPVLTDGTWAAGVDVPVGRWRSSGVPAGEFDVGCVWTVSNAGRVVDVGATRAGHPTFRLAPGDEVTLTGCGVWALTK